MLSESKAIVVGGLGGIGSAICNSFLEQKIKHLIIFDIHEDISDHFRSKSNVTYMKCHIDNREELKEAFNSVWKKFGTVDLVVNSAGIVNEQDAEKVFAINTVKNLYEGKF